jgi:hypothetical protein
LKTNKAEDVKEEAKKAAAASGRRNRSKPVTVSLFVSNIKIVQA